MNINRLTPAVSNITASFCQKENLSILSWLNDLEEKKIIDFDSILNIASDISNNALIIIVFFDEGIIHTKTSFSINAAEERQIEILCRKVSETRQTVELTETNLTGFEFVQLLGIPLKTSDHNVIGAMCLINYSDIVLQENQTNALENLVKMTVSLLEQKFLAFQGETRLKFLENKTAVEMFLVSPNDFTILFANRNALKRSGLNLKSIINRPITDILTIKDKKDFENKLHNLPLSAEKSFTAFAEQVNQDNSKVLLRLFVSFISDKFNSSILVVSRSLSETGFHSDFIDYLTNYDHITGLGNRRLFEKLFEEKIRKSPAALDNSALILIDLDNFEMINKSFGYRTGDNTIRQISETIVSFLKSDEILLRVGQNTLCLLLLNCNREEINIKAKMIINFVNNLDFTENGKKFKLQINVGGILFNSGDSKKTDYLSLANKVCDIAKELGQNQFYLADTKDSLLIQKNIEINQLIDVHDAIERNKIVLYRQKIHRISKRANKYTEHFEILCRMIGNEGKIVMPNNFIPQMEKHGSIILLDKWVLRESLRMIDSRYRRRKSNESLRGFMFNINVSVKSLSDESFIGECKELLTTYKHLAACICFEVTETVAISNFKVTKEFIDLIHEFGCKFALDDFGSGGASLECLKLLPIDFVKIDGSFVCDIVENPISQIIVKIICKIANTLKIQVIAEKVETEEVENTLCRYGIHYVQGYKIEHPIPFIN